MTPAEFQARILDPARAAFPFHDSPESRGILLAIAGQESGWQCRAQINDGPALGWWQFELGGVRGVVDHPNTHDLLQAFCAEQCVPFSAVDIHTAIEWHDPLAYALARLLLWTDPQPLPALGDYINGAAYYRRLWRPGKFDPARFATRYAEALTIEGPAVA